MAHPVASLRDVDARTQSARKDTPELIGGDVYSDTFLLPPLAHHQPPATTDGHVQGRRLKAKNAPIRFPFLFLFHSVPFPAVSVSLGPRHPLRLQHASHDGNGPDVLDRRFRAGGGNS